MKMSAISVLKKRVLPNIPYVFVFWFANKLGTAYRIADSKDIVNKIAGSMKTLGESMRNIMPSFHPFDLLIGICGVALILAFVYFKGKNAKKFRKNVEYGSACWGSEKNIKPYVDPKPENNIILTATESLTMNSRPSNPKYARNKNVLVIGGSGSGKTRFFCKPNIMQLHSSYVVTDPKGQILIECGNLLKDNNYNIKVLNTIDFKKSMRYNPFQYIKSEKDILKFVTALIANTKGEGKSSDDFWQKAETLLYQALVGYIWYESPPREKNMNTLVEMINHMEVREDDETFMNAVDFLFEALEERAPNHFALRQYKKYKLAAGKTAKSILISCGARLSPFDISEVRELVSDDELELDKLGGYKKYNPKTRKDEVIKEKTALFVIISDTDDSFNFIVALMYSQLFNLMCDRADNKLAAASLL
jgi:type IV secretion system protein VirD4